MASIFTKDDNFVDKPNRNTFDLSYQNNLSLKFGKLVPCFCQEVLPGDSFRIKPTFGLRFLPQVFPVQTRMRAHMHFFYVRNRTIWKDWMDFIGKTKSGLTMPYIQAYNPNPSRNDADHSFHESSIYDYMGLPVTVDSNENPINYRLFSYPGKNTFVNFTPFGHEEMPGSFGSYVNMSTSAVDSDLSYFCDELTADVHTQCIYRRFETPINYSKPNGSSDLKSYYHGYSDTTVSYNVYLYCDVTNGPKNIFMRKAYIRINSLNLQSGQLPDYAIVRAANEENISVKINTVYGYLLVPSHGSDVADLVRAADRISYSLQVIPSFNRNYPFQHLSANTLPYGSGDYQYRINALPFRAYEAIYNSFYRNPENNPFKINGVNEYNVYVKSLEGGEQPSTDFSLFNRNWEDDAFTTAVPTPQQGDAPRVGLTGNPDEPVELRWMSEDADVEGIIHLKTDSNGRVIMVGQDNPNAEPNTLVNALNDAINFGITINDLRNVNALQLWLEKNVRKGYKYRDQLLSHYGVSISYNDLLMPEFIGGVSRDVTVNQVTQTVETDTGNLGDMAGQAYVVGDGNAVTKYCDEHGYIIGILSVVPVPNYSQLIPKHFFKHDTFDYFFPEFGKIGMQPITCKEIAATASWLTHKGDETFGYQRAWYDYLANVDQVHGKFNGQFYDFLIQRKFGNVPELGADFTTIKNEDLNNIFYVDDGEDKILGQIYYDVKAIRPIPLFGIPSLE